MKLGWKMKLRLKIASDGTSKWRSNIVGRAAIKTHLKRKGFKVRRTFFGQDCCVCQKGNRFYRFRFWDSPQVVDISDLNFDRWGNSTERTVKLDDFLKSIGVE